MKKIARALMFCVCVFLAPALIAGTASEAKSWLDKANREGDLEKARDYYSKAALADPAGPWAGPAWMGLGKLEYNIGSYHAAKQAFDKAASAPGDQRSEAVTWSQASLHLAGNSSSGEGPAMAVRQSGGSRPEHEFTIQVGFYSQKKWAEVLAQKLKSKRYRLVQVRPQTLDGSRYYQVCIGRYKTKKEALAPARKVGAKEKLPFVIRTLD